MSSKNQNKSSAKKMWFAIFLIVCIIAGSIFLLDFFKKNDFSKKSDLASVQTQVARTADAQIFAQDTKTTKIVLQQKSAIPFAKEKIVGDIKVNASSSEIKQVQSIAPKNTQFKVGNANAKLSTQIIALKTQNESFAQISLQKFSEVNSIMYCPNWDFENSSCAAWQSTSIPFTQNSTHITFSVPHFTAYAGGFVNSADVISSSMFNGTMNISGNITLILAEINPITDQKLLALWHFNNNSAYGENTTYAYDYSGNGNNGTVYGDAAWNLTNGKFNGGFYFDGLGDYVSIPNKAYFDLPDDTSITMWVKVGAFDGLYSDLIGTYSAGWTFYLFPNDLTFYHNGGGDIMNGGVISTDTWYFLALTKNSLGMVMYKNASSVSTAGPQSITASSNPLKIATRTTGNFFTGWIDEVAVWNKSLSQQEIADLYRRGVSTSLNGTYTNQIEVNQSVVWDKIFFSNITPSGTNITYQVATSDDNFTWSQFGGPSGANSYYFDSGESLNVQNSRFLKYRFYLWTNDTTITPILSNISVKYFYPTTHNGSATSQTSFLKVWDDSEGNLTYPNMTVRFYANYSNFSSGDSINGTGVICEFSENSSGSWSPVANMAFNSLTKLYSLNLSISYAANKSFNITCNGSAQGFDVLSAIDAFSSGAGQICDSNFGNYTLSTHINCSSVVSSIDFLNITSTGKLVLRSATFSIKKANINGVFEIHNSKGTIWQNGNLTILGTYILDNSTLRMNVSSDGEFGINVSGTMLIVNGSNITTGTDATKGYFFRVYRNANFTLQDSYVDGAGYGTTPGTYDTRGLWINADGANIFNSTLDASRTASSMGLILYCSNFTNVSFSSSYSNNSYAVYSMFSSYNRFSNNTIHSNSNYSNFVASSINNTFVQNTLTSYLKFANYLSAASNSTFIQNMMASNTSSANYLGTALNNVFTNNTIISNTSVANYLTSSSNGNVFTNNTVSSEKNVANYLSYSSNNAFINNIISSNSSWTNYLTASSNNTFTNNFIFSNASYANFLLISSNNIFTNNTITSVRFYASYLSNSPDNTFIGNVISSNISIANYLYNFSGNNVFSNNIIIANKSYANYMYFSSNNTFTNNTITSSTGYANYLYNSSNNTFTNNTITSNLNFSNYFSTASNSNIFLQNAIYSNTSYCTYFLSSSNNNFTQNSMTSNANIASYVLYSSSNMFIGNNISALSGANSYGLFINLSNYTLVSHNLISSNDSYGLHILYGFNGSINYNNISSNKSMGIYIDQCNNNSFDNNMVVSNSTSISVSHSNYNSFTYNNFTSMNNLGFNLDLFSKYNVFANNSMQGLTFGLRISAATNNTFTDNVLRGIYLDTVVDTNFTKNTIRSGTLSLYSSSKNSFVDNLISTNIHLYSSSKNNLLIANNITTASTYAVQIDTSSNKNTLIGNNISALSGTSSYGLFLSDSNETQIHSNIVFSNNSYALYLYNSSFENLSNNIFNSSTNFGIYLKLASNSTFANSQILNGTSLCQLNITSNSTNNVLVNTTFDKSKVCFDVSLNSMFVYWHLDVHVNDSFVNLANANISIYNNTLSLINLTNTSASGWIPTQTLLEYWQNSTEKRSQTNYTVDAVMNSLYDAESMQINLTQSSTLYFMLHPETKFPELSLQFPIADSIYSAKNLSINFTAADINLDKCWLINSTEQKIDLPSCQNTTFIGVEGYQNITIYANDTSNNINSSQVFFSIDSTPPQILFVPPTLANDSVIGYNSTYINVSMTDASNTSAFIDFNRSLVGYWNFEQGFNDSSTYGNNGSCSGASCPTLASGARGKAYSFDGVDDYFSVPSIGNSIHPSNISVEAWIYLYSIKNSGIFALSNNGVVAYIGADGSVRLSKNAIDDFGSISTLNTNQWYHLVFTQENGTRKIYINDALDNSGAGSDFENSGDVLLGGVNTDGNLNDGFYFNGTIDEVRIWNRALSEEEINASYNAGLYRLESNFTDLRSGNYEFYAFAIDALGNFNRTDTTYFEDDLTPPFTTDTTGSLEWTINDSVKVNLSVVDNRFNATYYCTYESGSTPCSTFTESQTNVTQVTLTCTPNTACQKIIRYYSMDSFGNAEIPKDSNRVFIIYGSYANNTNASNSIIKDYSYVVDSILENSSISNCQIINSTLVNVNISANNFYLKKCLIENTQIFDSNITDSWIQNSNLESNSTHQSSMIFDSHLLPGTDTFLAVIRNMILEVGKIKYKGFFFFAPQNVSKVYENPTYSAGKIDFNQTYAKTNDSIKITYYGKTGETVFANLSAISTNYSLLQLFDLNNQGLYENNFTILFETDQASPIDSGLFDLWSFNGNLLDSVGAKNGIDHGSISFEQGKYKDAARFNGIDQWVEVQNIPAISTNPFTVELWMNSSAASGFYGLVTGKEDGTFFFGVSGNVLSALTPANWDGLSGTKNIMDGAWHHIVIVGDGADVKGYVDGTLDLTIPQGDIGATDFAIGCHLGVYAYYPGLMDEVMYYNRALSESEIQNHYLQGLNPGRVFDGQKNIILKIGDSLGNTFYSNATLIIDNTKPTGSISIDGGENTTSSRDVTLYMNYSDANGVNDCRYSNNYPITFEWEPCTPTKHWQLTQLYGIKTVYVQIKDNAGNILNVNDSIVYSQFSGSFAPTDPVVIDGLLSRDVDYTNLRDTLSAHWSSTDPQGQSLTYKYRITANGLQIYPAISGIDGLISIWSLEGNANDSVGSNSGQINGGMNCTSEGRFGSACNFDGSDDYIEIPMTASLNSTHNFSVAAWAKLNLGSGVQTIASRYDSCWSGSNDCISWSLRLYGNVPDFFVNQDEGRFAECTGSALPLGQWFYYTATYDGQIAILYINDTQVCNVSTGYDVSSRDIPIRIGNGAAGGGELFNGVIDEVSFFNKTLSQPEIESYFQNGFKSYESIQESKKSISNLSLVEGNRYAFEVIAINQNLLESNANISNGVIADFTNPNITSFLSTTHPNENIIYRNSTAVFQFIAQDNYYLKGFSYVLDQNPNTVPDSFTKTVESQKILPIESGLLNLWHFDENLSDSLGAKDGIDHSSISFEQGNYNGAARFNGIDQWAEVQNMPAISTNPFTVELWEKSSAAPGFYGLVTGKSDFTFFFGVSGNVLGVLTPENWGGIYGTKNIMDGAWHHIVIVGDGADVKGYVDGTLDLTIPQGDIGATDFAIGCHLGVYAYYPGLMDEVMYYNRALSESEIQNHYLIGADRVYKKTFTDLVTGTYYFHLKAVDGAGNSFTQTKKIMVESEGSLLRLNQPVSRTSADSINITGTSQDIVDVLIYVNGINQINVSSAGAFAAEINLINGTNKIYAKTFRSNLTTYSNTVSIFKTTPQQANLSFTVSFLSPINPAKTEKIAYSTTSDYLFGLASESQEADPQDGASLSISAQEKNPAMIFLTRPNTDLTSKNSLLLQNKFFDQRYVSFADDLVEKYIVGTILSYDDVVFVGNVSTGAGKHVLVVQNKGVDAEGKMILSIKSR